MSKYASDIDELADVPVRRLVSFMKAIAENDLWAELEQLLQQRGYDRILMSFHPVQAVGEVAMARSRERAEQLGRTGPELRCGCNGPLGPRPGPVLPGGGGDAGADAGSHPRSAWLAVRVDDFAERASRAASTP